MDLRNRFNPLRISGRDGLATREELSRVQDLIKTAFDELARQLLVVPVSTDPPPATAPSSLARYWLSTAHPTLPNGVDMGALGAGILHQTVGGGVATPGLVTVAAPLVFAGSTLSHAASGVAPGVYPFATVTVNATGHVTAVAAGSAAPPDATYITQTPSGSLTNEQALSLLATGVMQSTTGTGVVSTFAAGAARVPFGSGTGHLADGDNLKWNGVLFGLTLQELQIFNASTNTNALTGLRVGTDAAFANSFTHLMTGTNWTTAAGIGPNNGVLELSAGANPLIISNLSGGVVRIATGAARTARIEVAAAGGVTLSSLGTGLVKATAGLLSIAVAGTDYLAPAGTTPGTYDRVTVAASGLVTSGTSYSFTDGSVLYAASNQPAQDNANFYYDAANVRWGYGTNAPSASATATWDRSVNGSIGHFIHNGNAGTGTQAAVLLQTAASATYATTPYGILSATGGSFTPIGAIAAGSLYLESNSAVSGNVLALGSVGGQVVIYTGASRTAKVSVSNIGNVALTPGASTSGSPTLLAVTGPAHTGLAAGAEAIDINVNLARTVAFTGGSDITVQRAVYIQAPTYTIGTNEIDKAVTLAISGAPTVGGGGDLGTGLALDIESGAQAWHLATGDNYERVRAHWAANVWTLQSEAGGTGTVRALSVSAAAITTTATGANTVTGASVTSNATGGLNQVYATTGVYLATSLGSNPDILVEPTTISIRPNVSVASAAGLTLNAIKTPGTVTITGTTHVTNTAGVNVTSFQLPLYNGAGSSKTVDYAATVKIEAAPLGTNGVTVATGYALWSGGPVRIDKGLLGVLVSKTSANNLAIKPTDGNVAQVTGPTQVNGMWTGNDTPVDAWTLGSIVEIICVTTGFTVKHLTATSSDYAQFDLAGGADYAMTAGTSLRVYYNGTFWVELNRSGA